MLQIKDLHKTFGSLIVADHIDLEVKDGEALGIIGPNGAGKSTFFNLISGALQPDAGEIWLDGENITETTPQARCIAGIGRSYQIPRPFANLTVFENLLVGATFGQRKKEAEVVDQCGALLRKTGLLPKANKPASALNLLERKRLEMARALATHPRLLLLDEIAGGLTEDECRQLVATINDIKASGVTIIWIEHIVHVLLAVVDRLIVLNFGRKIAEGEPREVMASAKVQEIYMGISA